MAGTQGGYSPNYPSDIRTGAGIRVEKVGLAARFHLDYRGIQKLDAIPTAGLVVVQDPVSGAFAALDFSATAGTGTQTTRIGAVAIPANCNVVDLGDNRCAPMDYTNPDHFGKLIGLAKEAASPGGRVTIIQIGEIDSVSGAFTVGDPLYPAADGTLTNEPPPSGFRQFLGTATSATSILYKPDTARIFDPSSPLQLLSPSTFASFLGLAFAALPTSPDGLPSRAPWRNGDSISFVP